MIQSGTKALSYPTIVAALDLLMLTGIVHEIIGKRRNWLLASTYPALSNGGD
jgi:hypothetical protein